MSIFAFIGDFVTGIIGKTAGEYIKEKIVKSRVKKYSGDLSVNTNSFTDFLYSNEDKTIFLDIILSDEQNQELREDMSIEKKDYYHFSIPYDIQERMFGGHSIHIISKGNDFFYDSRFSSRRLKGHFYIQGYSGPHQGWMTTILIATPKYH